MATIQIRNIPDEVYLTYKSRAMRSRQSMQEYLLSKLIDDARVPSLDEILEKAERNAVNTLSTEDILGALDKGRAER
jgi:hypothetical protein